MIKLKRKILQSALSIIVFSLAVVLTLLVDWALAGSFSFRDEFTTSLGVGSVNGSNAEPGPGTRTVWDTSGTPCMSITGEKISSACGAGLFADPGIRWAGVTRTPGMMGLFEVTLGQTNKDLSIGFNDVATKAYSWGNFIYFHTTAALAVSNGYYFPTGTFTATTYTGAVAIRSYGAYYFIKGGTFTNWTLLFHEVMKNHTPIYPEIAQGAAYGNDQIDYFRIPSTLWLPSPTISDGFSGATSDGLGHPEGVAGGLGSGGAGLAWNDPGGTWTVAGGVLYNTPATGADLWDAPAAAFTSGTYGWTAGGTNTIANVSNTLAMTYVNDARGAYEYLSDAKDLSTNLTVGTWYKFTLDSSVNSGTYGLVFSDSITDTNKSGLSNTTPASYTITSRSLHATAAFVRGSGLGAGQVLKFDNLSLKALTLNTLFRTRDAGTANIVAEVKLGANPAGTQAGTVFNLDSASSPTTYGLLYYDGTNIKVDEIIASGTPTSKISSAYTWAAGTILRLIRDGTELRAYVWNGTTWVQVGTTQSMNAAFTGTLHGTFGSAPGATMDNFVLYPRGTEGQWGFLAELNSLDDGSDDLLLLRRRSRAGR